MLNHASSTAGNEHADAEEWISIYQLAERLNRTTVTLRNWWLDESTGFPRPTLIRRKRYFRMSEIARWERRFSDRLRPRAA